MINLSQPKSAEAVPEGSEDLPFALKELLRGAGARGVPELAIEGVNADSRTVAAGEAFFALPGTRVHGDSFAAQAIGRGASAMVTDRVPDPVPAGFTPWQVIWTAGQDPQTAQAVIARNARVGTALEALAAAHQGGEVVVVSHGGAIRAAVAHALGVPPDRGLHISVQNLSLTRLERHPEGWQVICVNELPGY